MATLKDRPILSPFRNNALITGRRKITGKPPAQIGRAERCSTEEKVKSFSVTGILIGLCVSLTFWATTFPAPAAKAAPTWDWQLDEPVKFNRTFDVVDTDPDIVTPAQIARLKQKKTWLICYVSVGTLEAYRTDVASFPRHVIGKTYEDWPDERFLDIRQLDVLLPLMKTRFQKCRDKGFDAVEPDNMDVHENDSGFNLTEADALTYFRALATLAHKMDLAIGQKNLGHLSEKLAADFDFAITESCFQDQWCSQMKPYLRRGKPVFDAEYTDRPINWKNACATARQLGLSMILKARDLTQKRQSCD